MTPLRVGLLCSHRAPGLGHLIGRDPNRGRLYEIVCGLTSEESCADERLAAGHAIPFIVHPIRRFCRTRGSRLSDPLTRLAYDHATAERLAGYRLDLVVLASYQYVLTDPMLAAFPDRILNIHHSDLTLRTGNGAPLLPGLRAVRDAVLAGLPETRATVHVVTKELDAGPPLLRSWPFPVAAHASHALKAYARAHQDWMIRATWGPLAAAAIELVARGRVDLSRLGPPWDLDEAGRIHRAAVEMVA